MPLVTHKKARQNLYGSFICPIAHYKSFEAFPYIL